MKRLFAATTGQKLRVRLAWSISRKSAFLDVPTQPRSVTAHLLPGVRSEELLYIVHQLGIVPKGRSDEACKGCTVLLHAVENLCLIFWC